MTSYAAINSLILMKRYDEINRSELYRLFYSLKESNGSFRVHLNGF